METVEGIESVDRIKVRVIGIHGMKDFVVVSMSHGGLGSCFYSNGQLHLGYDGFAGEVGHTCVEINGRERDVLGASALAWDVKEYSLFK